jgi:hypothetical protein
LSNRSLKRYQKAVSTLESDSPVDLYWLHRQKNAGEPQFTKLEKGDKTIISESFWDDFVIVAKAVKLRNPDADIYDAFNFIREHMMGGWAYDEDGAFIQRLDAEVEREYQKEKRKIS